MVPQSNKFTPKVPVLNLEDERDMLTEFAAEAHKHLLNAKNSLLVLDTVPDDRESIDHLFKAFHTIKGLADFLSLDDMCLLTKASEELLDRIRKGNLKFQNQITSVTKRSIESLYTLLQLLNEQIINNGQLQSLYHDVGPVLAAIEDILNDVQGQPVASEYEIKHDIPIIAVDKESSYLSSIEEKLSSGQSEISIDRETMTNLLNELKHIRGQLKDAQSKVLENQRELVKERELAVKMTQQAQTMARTKSEFLASMAHEIRTLINAILGFTNLIKKGPLTGKQDEQLDTIIMSGNLLLGIVNNILDFSKVEAGKLKLENITLNLDALIEDVFKILRTRLNSKPITLFYDIDKKVPRNLLGDPTRLKQVFINLLDNAIKFTDAGEVGLTIRLQEEASAFDKKCVLSFIVTDTGIGIPENLRDKIFESFTQAHSSVTRKYGGTGLGLTLCRSYIENMGGKIWVESRFGEGSQFNFTATFGLSKEAATKPKNVQDIAELKKKQIVIVEKNKRTIKEIETLCKEFGINIYFVTNNILKVVEQLSGIKDDKKSLPDIIFIGVSPQEKDGFVLASKIRQDKAYKNVRLIAVSADINLNDAQKLHKNGFDDFLARPIIRHELINALCSKSSQRSKTEGEFSSDELQAYTCEGLKVLVAEDSIPNQELLRAHFETLGCDVDYVANGQEAVEKVKENDYNICFMDLQMPIMSGLEACKFIRQNLKKNLPIVALTAAEIEDERARCFDAGMNDYLAKPFDFNDLKLKIVSGTKKA
jgi:signal transduction histidine kinase/DNA-binding response OmpR family regulator